MKSFLIRLYPARWRARYGDEFEAILDERPLGPFDVADIILGALDAQLKLRGHGVDTQQARRFTMSLRIGGFAAVIGAPLWTVGFMISSGAFGNADPRTFAVLIIAGSLALLVALTGLSAFQARVQPALSWAAFALPAVGTIGLMIGAFGFALGADALIDLFFFGLMTFFIGSMLFAIATYRTAVLSRPAAVLLGITPVLAFAAGNEGGSREILIVADLILFTLGWVVMGVQAIRQDRAVSAPQSA